MSSIIYLHNRGLAEETLFDDVPGFKNYKDVSKLMGLGNSMIDRTGNIQDPFRTKIIVPVPAYDPDFKLNYHDCCMQRMIDFDEQFNRTGKKFRLMYSGGIDSSAILASFINFYGLDKAAQMIEICCSPESIDENPWLWDRYIRRGKFKLVSSHKHTSSWDSSVFKISGEVNDQLFNGDGIARYKKNRDLYSTKNFDDYVYASFDQKNAVTDFYINVLDVQLKAAPFPLENFYMYMWWRNFVSYYGTNQIKPFSQIRGSSIPMAYLENSFGQFFGSDNFQKWSMVWHRDYPESFCDYDNQKKPCKDFIMSVLDIPEFSDKMKHKSYPRIHNKRRHAAFIDDQFNIYYDWNQLRDFIEPNNSYL